VAIVEFGAGVVNIVGSIRGWTFQFTRAGTIVRTKPIQRKSSTPKQTAEQAAFVTQIQAFQVLSLGDKVAWDAFAAMTPKENKFGQQKLLTGQNWFVSVNSALARLGLPQQDTPPANILPVPITSFNLTVDPTKIEIDGLTPNNPTDTGIFIDTTFPTTQLSRAQRSPFRVTDTVNSGPFGTIDLTTDWETAHALNWPAGTVNDCVTIGVRLQPVNTVTGITGAAITLIRDIDSSMSGIGFMEIGVDFIVS